MKVEYYVCDKCHKNMEMKPEITYPNLKTKITEHYCKKCFEEN